MNAEMIAVVVFVVAAMLGVVLVRRRVPLEQLVEHHEVAGICFAVVGGLYGIILAFVLVSSWERYEAARAQTEFEASSAADLFRHSEGFNEPTRSKLGDAIIAYMHSVIDDEFPAMAEGHTSLTTQQRYLDVWRAVTELRPTDAWEVALYQNTLQELDNFADGRRHRIFYMQSGLPDEIWIFLIVFGIAMVAFSYLFGMPRLGPQLAITGLLAATIACTLVLVRETQTPFSGGLHVTDRAFHVALDFMHHKAVVE